ncbi:MAG: glycosyltransferase [Burkholderiales bacterium]|nr:glycosyltransferase [Phycisphaerae bacterium]
MAGALPHVVHVISSVDPRAGGTTTQLVSLVKAQVELGMTVSVISTYANDFDPSAAEIMQAGGAYLELVGPCTAVMAWHPKISRVLRDVVANSNLLHIHGLWEEIQHRAAVIARESNIPYLFSLHGTLEPWSMQQSRLKKQIYMAVRMKKNLAEASALHYSDSLEQELTRDWRLSTPAIIQGYAVDLSPFERMPSQGMFRRAFPAVGDTPYALFLGRLHPRKGLDILMQAFAAGALQNTMLVIAGPTGQDGYLEELKRIAEEFKITDRVIFTGMVEGNIRSAAFADATVSVMPSHSDNFGTAAIESLACGTPVIISDHVAMSRQIALNSVGEVVAVALSPISDAINKWMSDPAKSAQTGALGRDWAFRNFDSKASALAWAQHYDDILTGQIGLRGGRAMTA